MGGTLRDELRQAYEQLFAFAFSLLEAIVIFLLAAIAVRALRRPVRRRLVGALLPENAKTLIENGVTLGVYLAAGTILLTLWGVSWSTLFAAIGVSTLFVAFGLQGVLQSLVAGIFILFERPYNVGDHIRFSNHDVEGAVEEVALRSTVIRTEDGTRVVAPNSLIFTQAVVNHSPDRAVQTVVTVSGVGEPGRTADDLRALVEATLVGVPALTSVPEVTIRARLAKLRVPAPVARIPRLGTRAERLMRTAIERTTQARVIWSGSSEPAVREEVIRRLKELFPDASIGARRM